MTVSVALQITPAAPAHGETVTATYVVTGNAAANAVSATLSGSATVGATVYPVSATFTMPGTPALPQVFSVPTAPGLTFSTTSNPAVFTAVVP